MTIQEVIQKLQAEKQHEVPSRYHGRAILVNDIAQYAALLTALKQISGARVIGLDELFSGADVMPNYQNLTDKAYEDQWVILPGVSEYLRLFHINEETAQRLGHMWHHQFAAKSTGRILIPLWGCETLWHDPALGLSETCFNEQWHQMELPYEKYDKLDKLAHKGVIDDKDYYACIEEQLQFVCKVVTYVNKLLKQHSRVLITGDHGTSRLAARFFHKLDGIPAPAKAEVGSHGRFCRITADVPIMETQKTAIDDDGNRYIVFANYDHYTKSGFAAGSDDDTPIYGEIHGGATPEEMLVPVITVNSRHEMPLTAKWMMPSNTVKIQSKRAKCRIQFSKPVAALQARIGEKIAECKSGVIPSKDWIITFSDLKLDKPTVFEISVLADGIMVNMDMVTIKPALGGGDPF